MSNPVIAAKKPCLVKLEAGRAYLWCACGRSTTQPFCDNASHEGTGIEPVVIPPAAEEREALLCMCKHTGSAPHCDGAHNNLEEVYEEADEEEIAASANTSVTPFDGGEHGTAMLDGGCFVRRLSDADFRAVGNWRVADCIGAGTGAKFLSHFVLQVDEAGDALGFGASGAALFVRRGAGRISIAGRSYDIAPETALYVGPDEALRLEEVSEGPIEILAAVCPQGPMPQEVKESGTFNARIPDRAVAVDEGKREVMANRFYQVLIGPESDMNDKSIEVTEFIGEIPKSRAAAHRHLYEETITILSGEGFMWTENARAAVRPGDVIFLPRRQLHSLECTSPNGMRLMGAFYPSGSPAINY